MLLNILCNIYYINALCFYILPINLETIIFGNQVLARNNTTSFLVNKSDAEVELKPLWPNRKLFIVYTLMDTVLLG